MAFPLRRVLDPITEPVSLSDVKNYLRVDITDDDELISSIISAARERAEDLTARSLLSTQWVFSMDRFPYFWEYEDTESGYFGRHHSHRHSMFRSNRLEIILPRGPVLSIDSIQYKDLSGTVQTLDPGLYSVDLLSEPARIAPAYGCAWPAALFDLNSVTIKFTCGYQQTVTEIVTLAGNAAPYSATVSRATTALSLTSAVDVVSGDPVQASLLNGVITVASGTVGQQIEVVYQTTNVPNSFILAIKLLCGTYYDNRTEVQQGGGNFNSLPVPLSASSLLATYDLFPLGYPKG